MSKSDLKLEWATHSAAKYACENWHYSKCMPVGKLVKVGAWEKGKFVGVVLFGRGANKSIGAPFGCDQTQSCELVRIALTNHTMQVSRIMTLAIKFMKTANPNMRLVVSFADPDQGHHGGIYQACNWVYAGLTNGADEYIYKGKRWHGRAFRKSNGSHLKYVNDGLQIVDGSRKHRYLMPLDSEILKQIKLYEKPYPKRVKKANSGDQSECGGAVPTHTLQICEAV